MPVVPGPAGPAADADAILRRAVDEAARLLATDGAMAYLLDPESGILRFAHDAGITDDRRREWVRSLKVDIGVGMFGRAVAEGEVTVTGDYQSDTSFVHFPDADRLVQDIDIHSFVVAPLRSGDRIFGAMGTFSSRRDAFGDAEVALVRALADHAAAAMANADLIEQLGRSRAEVEHRAEAERALREIGGRIIALRHPEEVLQRSVDEAARLLGADGARIDILDEKSGGLYWAYDATTGRLPGLGPIAGTGEAKAGEGISGRAVREMRAVFTGDYLNDDRFEHASAPDEHVRKNQIRSVVAVPLVGDRGPLGTLTVYTSEVDAFSEDDARLIEALAGQAAIAMTNARLIEELARSRAEFSRRADAEKSVREINANISAIRDPDAVLQQTVDEARRLLDADSARIDLLEGDTLTWAFASGRQTVEIREAGIDTTSKVGEGVTGTAVALRRPFRTNDYLDDPGFAHLEASDALVRDIGVRSVVSAPLLGEAGALGALSVSATRPSAFGDAEEALLQALADQAAITIQNARLIAELNRSRTELRRRAEEEQSLREIALRISATKGARDVLQRTVDEAARLLEADTARIDLIDAESGLLRWAYHSATLAPSAPWDWPTAPDERIEQGISGQAVLEGRVAFTGDYLNDRSFVHSSGPDGFVAETGIRSVMSAPLFGEGRRPFGAITIYTTRLDAWGEADARLIEAIADQAAIAITNARLIEELDRSQRRARRRADDGTGAARHRRPDHVAARPGSDPAPGRRGGPPPARHDGAHLTRMSETGTYLVPVIVAGGMDGPTEDWLKQMQFPLGGGINGLAAEEVRAGLDGRLHGRRHGSRTSRRRPGGRAAGAAGDGRGAAAGARRRGDRHPGDLVRDAPRDFVAGELDLLQGLADQAAIAITNSTLLDPPD